MSENHKTNESREIELRLLFDDIWNKAPVIILFGMTVALLVIVYTQVFGSQEYQVKTKIFVMNGQYEKLIASSDMEASTALTQDFAQLIKSRTILENAIWKLDLDMEYEELLDKITVTVPVDGRIITIEVINEDPYTASDLANTVCDMAVEQIRKVMNVERINVIERADIPIQSTGLQLKRNGLMGGMAGIFLALCAVVWNSLSNTTIHDSKDVQHYLKLEILGTIPKISDHTEKSKLGN